jgi:hypothetical protein
MPEKVTKSTIRNRFNRKVGRWETDELSLTIFGGATPSRETEAIDVRGYSILTLTIDHKREGSDSTSIETTVYSSVGGSEWHTEPYESSVCHGAYKLIKTISVTSGVSYLKLKVENKDPVNFTKVKLILTGRMGKVIE